MSNETAFWIWMSQCNRPDQEMIQGTHPVITKLSTKFDQGKFIADSVPLIRMSRCTEYMGRLTDNLFAPGMRSLVISSKLQSLLLQNGVDNIQYFPIQLENPVDESLNNDYRLANIIGRVDCIDIEKSELEMNPDDISKIEFINSIVFTSEFRNRTSDLKLFRAYRYFPLIVVRNDIKTACEKAGITGITFMHPKDAYI